MFKKKTLCALVLAGMLVFSGMPVMAANLSDGTPAGEVPVTGIVSGQTPGGVTYTVSIPDAIDFGTLRQPDSNTEPHYRDIDFETSLVEVNGLENDQRVAVLMEDMAATDSDTQFRISGQDATNSDKSLYYDVYAITTDGDPINSSDATVYPNGYLFTGFARAGDTTNGILRLDQNQLYLADLTQWAGNYRGTVRFFTTVASLQDYM